jgi:3-oxoacyl-[acyl-carrier protein] reductase
MNSHLTAEEISFIIDEIPADRLGTASEVADLVYMVSEMSTYMTGQIITIDGGWTL